jgi:hypothetical protein
LIVDGFQRLAGDGLVLTMALEKSQPRETIDDVAIGLQRHGDHEDSRLDRKANRRRLSIPTVPGEPGQEGSNRSDNYANGKNRDKNLTPNIHQTTLWQMTDQI